MNMIRLPSKIRSRPIKITLLVILLAILAGAVLAVISIVQQKSEIFQSVDRFPKIDRQTIDNAIVAGVKIDRKVTIDRVRENLTMMELDSGGTQYFILRIALPETCGELGCLYIVKSKEVTMPKLLQLQGLTTGEQMFVPTEKPGCFEVIQIIDRARKNFPICEETR
jgi:hypothetical protein